MFRTTKCSSSGRLVHTVLWYFCDASMSSSLVDGRMCLSLFVTKAHHSARFKDVKFLLLSPWLFPCIFILKTAAVMCVETSGRLYSYAPAISG